MKKILCGALVLLAAVAAFTSCKKKDNNGDAVSSLILSATELQMSPGDDAKKLTVKTNTGTVVTYEWSTDDADNAVITMAAKGSTATITPVGVGTATVTVKVKGNETLTAECFITVIDKMQTLTFSRLCYTYDEPPTNIDSTKVFIYNSKFRFDDKQYEDGVYDTIRCYYGDIYFRLLADGAMIVDDEGIIQAKDANGAYSIMVTANVPVLARCINTEIFDHLAELATTDEERQAMMDPSLYTLGTIAKGGKTWLGDGKEQPWHFEAGSVDEAKYVEFMGKAFTEDYPEDPTSEKEEDWEAFYTSRDAAIGYVKGAYLAKWYYNSRVGRWLPSSFPYGIVSTLNFRITDNTNTDEIGHLYTSVIEAADIIIKPFGGLENYGLDMTLNKLTGKYVLNSQEFQWGETIDCSF